MTYSFDKIFHWIVIAAILVGSYLLLHSLRAVLLPFLVAWLLAYLLNPLVVWLKVRMKLKYRLLPVILVFMMMLVAFGGLVVLLIPTILDEIERGRELFMRFWMKEETQTFVLQTQESMQSYFQKDNIAQMLNAETVQTVVEKVVPSMLSFITHLWKVVAALAVVVITFLYQLFIMLDYDKINSEFRHAVPIRYRTLVYGILDDIEEGMNSYFRGQSLVALLVGVGFAIGFAIIGLPLGITLGLFIGVLNLVPYLQTVGLIPVFFLAALKSAECGTPYWVVVAECAAVFLVVQSTQDMLLVPKIMGKAMGLKPAIILLSLSIWGSLLGFIGLIIALPLTTLIISYYKRYVLKENNLLEAPSEE
ncbi:MAG: AI-2E family transporter [Paludibacteraceae bacterium]|nr:AI-2E family transporter [Paludibacteraceae bacterium]